MASGDPPNTARKKPTGKKAKRLSQKEQSKRFIETARELGVDETGQKFDLALGKVLRPRVSSKSTE